MFLSKAAKLSADRRAFTVVEVLLVAVIIGVLAAAGGWGFLRVRLRAIDAKRLYDIKQIQYALDRYAEDQGGQYPDNQEFIVGGSLVSKNGHVVYLKTIPHNPDLTPGGNCLGRDYAYRQGLNARSYTLIYCLENAVSRLAAGECVAMPGLICSQPQCACDNSAKECCGYCLSGDGCGGGFLFADNYEASGASYHLVVNSLNGAANFLKWDDSYPFSLTGANDRRDGKKNTDLLGENRFQAAATCRVLEQNGFSDWYLPAVEELAALYTARQDHQLFGALTGLRHSSTETQADKNLALDFAAGVEKEAIKSAASSVSCVRRGK